MSSFEMTYKFHEAMGLPAHRKPRTPSVTERVLRAKLLLEETIETIEKGLGLTIVWHDNGYGAIDTSESATNGHFGILHREGQRYDPVETLDGLADVKVIANGTAVAFGLPMEAADREVFESNMSKLDSEGKPIVNKCIQAGCEDAAWGFCDNAFHLIDGSQPVGKVLKGPNFRKPDIEGLLKQVMLISTDSGEITPGYESPTCPEHPWQDETNSPGGFGLAGGGFGAYNICPKCGRIFNKIDIPDDEEF